MANRRMFALSVIDTDQFMEMPLSAQALYFHLGMRADDDGFVSSPKRILRVISGNEDDLRILISKGYATPFESGVIVLNHWNVNNYLRKDRYTPTLYETEKRLLNLTENRMYEAAFATIKTNGIPTDTQTVYHAGAENSIDKNSIDKNSGRKRPLFIPPTAAEVIAYCKERQNRIDPEQFIDYYAARGWELTKGRKMKDWKAVVRTWERNSFNSKQASTYTPNTDDADISDCFE